MANTGEIVHRAKIATALAQPLAAHDPYVRHNMYEGDLVEEVAGRQYMSRPLDPDRASAPGNPVHWLMLVPGLDDGRLATVEFGLSQRAAAWHGLEYDADAERAAVRNDIATFLPEQLGTEKAFYRNILPAVVRRVLREQECNAFAGIERRYAPGQEEGWSQLYVARGALKTARVADHWIQARWQSGQSVSVEAESIARNTPESTMAHMVALNALAEAAAARPHTTV